MGYSNLTLDEYATLSLDEYAQLSLDGGSGTGGDENVSCVWNETRIASLESSISELKTMIQTLQTKVNSLPTATYTVPTASQIATSVWSASSRTVTNSIPTVAQIQSGLATSTSITSLQNHGDSNWKTATGFATPEDVESVDVSGLATSSQVSALQTSVNAIPTENVDVSGLETEIKKVFALIANWSVSGTVLTAKSANGSTLGTFTLTKDTEGNITAISPQL